MKTTKEERTLSLENIKTKICGTSNQERFVSDLISDIEQLESELNTANEKLKIAVDAFENIYNCATGIEVRIAKEALQQIGEVKWNLLKQ